MAPSEDISRSLLAQLQQGQPQPGSIPQSLLNTQNAQMGKLPRPLTDMERLMLERQLQGARDIPAGFEKTLLSYRETAGEPAIAPCIALLGSLRTQLGSLSNSLCKLQFFSVCFLKLCKDVILDSHPRTICAFPSFSDFEYVRSSTSY